jgi:hypothetical protein
MTEKNTQIECRKGSADYVATNPARQVCFVKFFTKSRGKGDLGKAEMLKTETLKRESFRELGLSHSFLLRFFGNQIRWLLIEKL